jgi:aminoglycoside phosphotransferase (APT) family kinase protein
MQVLWGMAAPVFLERNGSHLSQVALDAIDWLSTHASAYLERPRWPTVVHGDYRVDNLLFGRERVIVVDWQTVALGPALSDVSYFLGGSLAPGRRAALEEELVRHYHERLVAAGGDIGWDECWHDYRRYALDGLVMAVVAGFLVVQTERGDAMFRAMAEGSAHHAADLETASLV